MIPDQATMEQWREEATKITDPYERRDFLASKLERLEVGDGRGEFNITRVRQRCGAPGCVKGWAVYFWGSDDYVPLEGLLGLSACEASDIFDGWNPITRREFYTPRTAARILREAPRPPLSSEERK